MGRSLPLRTGTRRAAAAILGVRRAAALAHYRAAEGASFGAVALLAALAQIAETDIRHTGKTSRPHVGFAVYGSRTCACRDGIVAGGREIRDERDRSAGCRRDGVARLG